MNMSAIAEAKSARQLEINRATDFVTEEIRKAKYINTDGTTVVDGTTTDIVDLLNNQGFDLTKLGNYGDLTLYLEVPAVNSPPLTCPQGGPNAGSPPPSPSDFDQVIYDIRASSSEWLAPRTVMRYGRIHDFNSSFNPCDSPVASDPIADALSDDGTITPNCSGTLTGGAGFYTCGEDSQTRLIFQSTLVDSTIEEVSSNVTSRVQSFGNSTSINVDCANENNLRALNNTNPTYIEFANQSTNTMKLFKLDETGIRQSFALLNQNAGIRFWTHETHPWIVTDLSDSCLAIYMPEDNEDTLIILDNSLGAS